MPGSLEQPPPGPPRAGAGREKKALWARPQAAEQDSGLEQDLSARAAHGCHCVHGGAASPVWDCGSCIDACILSLGETVLSTFRQPCARPVWALQKQNLDKQSCLDYEEAASRSGRLPASREACEDSRRGPSQPGPVWPRESQVQSLSDFSGVRAAPGKETL